MSITIDGKLDRDATHVLSGATRNAFLVLTVNVGAPQPFEIRHEVGSTPEAHINAERLASKMRRGAPVIARGQSLRFRNDHGEAVYVLTGAEAIRVADWELQ